MIGEKVKSKARKEIKKKIVKYALVLIKPFLPFVLIILAIFLLVCYITDIFYIGKENKDEIDMKKEVKYYSDEEFSEEKSKSFFESVENFIAGIFEIRSAEFPVVKKSKKDITSYYGYRDLPTAGATAYHNGIDIGAAAGTELVTIMDGIVTSVGWAGGGGYTIRISSEEYSFTYSHSDPNFIVKVGDKVRKGQVIGKVGPKNVYGVPGNPFVDSEGKPTNRGDYRKPLSLYSGTKWRNNRSTFDLRRGRNNIMIVIYTGNKEVDKILENEIKGSMVISYAEFLIEDDKFKEQTVILSSSAIKENFREYLYMLRSKNIRVILLMKNKKEENVRIALENGIYDLVFGNFYPSQIREIIDKPRRFSDIAKLYEKTFNIKLKGKSRLSFNHLKF